MRIALDATYSVGDRPTGVGVYCREILRALAAAHPEVSFLYCYRPHRFLASLGAAVPANGRRRIFWETWTPAAALFHGLNQRLPRARLRRAVATFHDLFVLTGDYATPEFRARFAAQAREAAARSDLIIAVSQFTARQVRDLLGVESARVRVVPHGIKLRPAPSGVARERLILHVGAIQRRKNIVRLIEAFERIEPGWRLALAGGSGYGAEEILDRIRRSSRRDDIEVLGYVSEERLAELYARAAVLAFPSLEEGFGLPVLEAMASGVPVLTSNRSAPAEIAGNAAVLVDPEDSEAIAHGLQALLADSSLREKLVTEGYKRAAEFSWERAAAQTWAVYQYVL
ncbi:MAG: glycosyltransferase family 1 protein [Bryobacterales bacterium]|nr:glycosyltransferase family 4 protein [Bryobacteraceae bacterium]MDW8353293.1 glycosyltransferase family 1 protein [Bryobacterales bacterium]